MVYQWGSAWVPQTAKPMLVDGAGKPFESRNFLDPEFGPGTVKADFVIPDIMCHHGFTSEYNFTLMVSDKVAEILSRWDDRIALTPQALYWPDGSLAARRHVITRFTKALPLDAGLSKYALNGREVRLCNVDDRFVFDTAATGPPHIWKSREISDEGFFGTDECIDELVRAEPTGLTVHCYAEHKAGVLTGPLYRPEDNVFSLLCFKPTVTEGPADGNLDKVRTVDPVPELLERIAPRCKVAMGVPVAPEHLPSRWRFGSKERGLAGYRSSANVHTVSPAFRDIIERFDPGRHQFFPLDYVTRKGDLIEKRFLLVIGVIIDALDRERSDPSPYRTWRTVSSDRRNVWVDRAKVAGSHLWFDHLYGHNNDCFVSYDLARALERENAKQLIFRRYPLRAIGPT